MPTKKSAFKVLLPSPATGQPTLPIPKFVSIAGHKLPVNLVSKAVLEGDQGEWDHNEYVIRIAKDLPLHLQWSTLYHEMTHATLYLTGWSDTLERKDVNEEGMVLAFEHFLVPAILALKPTK